MGLLTEGLARAGRHPRTPRPATSAARRALAVLAVLPLLALAACGYGSQAKDDARAGAVAGAPKTDGLDSVRIGYFGNITHATALVGARKGFFQRALGGTEAKYAVFNAGPSEIEALNSGSLGIRLDGPVPRDQRLRPVRRPEPADRQRLGVRRGEAGPSPTAWCPAWTRCRRCSCAPGARWARPG
ncbi:hypothetical protein SFUMM280S_10495 [Streptomyces fumanus]